MAARLGIGTYAFPDTGGVIAALQGEFTDEQVRDGIAQATIENIVRDVIGARMPLFHTHIVVDWSARSKPSPARPTRDAIWWAGARVDGSRVPTLEPKYARTRDDALRCLARLIADELDAGRHVLAGFDFPFGYPEGVAAHLTGKASALALWDWLAERIEDAPNNANNRYEVAAAIKRRLRGAGPVLGSPWKLVVSEHPGAEIGAHRTGMPPVGTSRRRSMRRGREGPFGNWPMPALSAPRSCSVCPL